MTSDERGFSLIDLLASLAIIGILAMIMVPSLLMAWDRGRQRKTVAEMRNLSTALATYQLDTGGFPAGLDSLVPSHYSAVPIDGWQRPYFYQSVGGGCSYIMVGLGLDGGFGPVPPDPWIGDSYEPDIWLVNGTFLQAPGLPVETSNLGPILVEACS